MADQVHCEHVLGIINLQKNGHILSALNEVLHMYNLVNVVFFVLFLLQLKSQIEK